MPVESAHFGLSMIDVAMQQLALPMSPLSAFLFGSGSADVDVEAFFWVSMASARQR